eukprot:TRINITY_DN35473_c0_g1_i1.p1 TRINITY_DN35473_c0_g1~~TRINITY_DN35473_c0_g1_i1.p1  ORF type:complete len:523 (+),score=56.50 TRINITY_DN35473_c0_g1_i1:92-1570(+)
MSLACSSTCEAATRKVRCSSCERKSAPKRVSNVSIASTAVSSTGMHFACSSDGDAQVALGGDLSNSVLLDEEPETPWRPWRLADRSFKAKFRETQQAHMRHIACRSAFTVQSFQRRKHGTRRTRRRENLTLRGLLGMRTRSGVLGMTAGSSFGSMDNSPRSSSKLDPRAISFDTSQIRSIAPLQSPPWSPVPILRRRSSQAVIDSISHKESVGEFAAIRASRRGQWEADLSGKIASGAVESDAAERDWAGLRKDRAVAFVARRIYRRLRRGSQEAASAAAEGDKSPAASTTTTPRGSVASLLALFDETEFLDPERKPRWACFWPFNRWFSSGKDKDTWSVNDISSFLHGLTTWCALPTDLIVVTLVYMDRLLDESVHPSGRVANGRLTASTWRPILAVCMLLASKVWEDWCMFGFEIAEYMEYTAESVLRLELLAMDTFRWNVNISAEVFAPYFWAVTRFLEDGQEDDDMSDALLHRPSQAHLMLPATSLCR